MPTIPTERTEERMVKHEFSPTERLELGSELARALQQKDSIETEAEGVKASYKAKVAEAESKVANYASDIQNGFTMRRKKCRVVFRPKDRKKDYYAEIKDGIFDTKVVLTDDMTDDDFQAELFQAEQQFERRAEVVLFKGGLMVLGRLAGKWYAALRVKVGAQGIEERLDPGSKKYKTRPDAVKATVSRICNWLSDSFGEETAKGFDDSIQKVLKVQEGLEE
jgi:hypothetical protein